MRFARLHLWWLVVAALLLTGCGAGTAAPEVAAPPAAVAPSAAPPSAAAKAIHPVGLQVPAIGVDTEGLLDLGIDKGGKLEVPPDALTAGWFKLSPAPGATGPAVIAAHVDYNGVPGVFSKLSKLTPGDKITVKRADGSEAVFKTYQVDRYPKASFPSQKVYGDTTGPELRLITCGGVFDHGTGQYKDNVVAYAKLVETR